MIHQNIAHMLGNPPCIFLENDNASIVTTVCIVPAQFPGTLDLCGYSYVVCYCIIFIST